QAIDRDALLGGRRALRRALHQPEISERAAIERAERRARPVGRRRHRGQQTDEDEPARVLTYPRPLIARDRLPERLLEHERAPLERRRQIEDAAAGAELSAVHAEHRAARIGQDEALEAPGRAERELVEERGERRRAERDRL